MHYNGTSSATGHSRTGQTSKSFLYKITEGITSIATKVGPYVRVSIIQRFQCMPRIKSIFILAQWMILDASQVAIELPWLCTVHVSLSFVFKF